MGNYTNELVKRKILELRERMGGRCVNPLCENPTEDLQFAHVKRTKLNGRGRGRKERYYDVVKNPDCYILLTKDCHKRFDRGEFCFADFNTFQCPNWRMFWEVVYVETFIETIQNFQANLIETDSGLVV